MHRHTRIGADGELRTHDDLLGRQALYQLSYVRKFARRAPFQWWVRPRGKLLMIIRLVGGRSAITA